MSIMNYLWRSGFIILIVLVVISCIGQVNQKKESLTDPDEIRLEFISSYSIGDPEVSSAEIVAFDPVSKKLFAVNSLANKLEILDLSSPEKINAIRSIELNGLGGGVNSVAIGHKLVAVAIENHKQDKNGWVVFFDTDGNLIHKVEAGVMPDMVTFSPDKKFLLVANE